VRYRWSIALAGVFVFRLLFGLSSDFFFEDQTQVYLLGLRHYATLEWPYFGADVVWTKSEIPGALQPLLVGVPLRIVPLPESPFVALNVISTAALFAFAWYLGMRFPASPRWLLWGWLLTIPWTLQFSTNIINTSYILPAALVFFIGFFESIPTFRVGVLSGPVGHALMGAALGWLIQIHMSWPLLLPFTAGAWLSGRRDGARSLLVNLGALAIGALAPGMFLIPTWIRYGFEAGDGGTLRNLTLHVVNPTELFTTLARFLSFPSLEINRFIATDGAKRLAFFQRHLWLAPVAAVVFVAGTLQPLWMVVELARRRDNSAAWRAIRWLVVGSVAIVYASYAFVIEPPQAHAFYVLSPVAFMFAAYCWSFVDSPRTRRVAAWLLGVNIAFHAGFAWAQMPEKSMYKNREPVAAAIRFREPEMFAHRRPFAIGGGPLSLLDPSRPYDPIQDVEVSNAGYQVGLRGSTDWTVTVKNRNPRVAYRDLLYYTTYRDAGGNVVDERHEVIKDIFEPGDVRTLSINDGFVRVAFAAASFRIAAAEALLPAANPSRSDTPPAAVPPAP
jgi:hypothetical protein